MKRCRCYRYYLAPGVIEAYARPSRLRRLLRAVIGFFARRFG